MGAVDYGRLLGTIAASLLIPAILMIGFKLIRATKRKHGLVYGLPGALAIITPFASGVEPLNIAASAILLAIFVIGYFRATRR